jgi:hypothetical protein
VVFEQFGITPLVGIRIVGACLRAYLAALRLTYVCLRYLQLRFAFGAAASAELRLA